MSEYYNIGAELRSFLQGLLSGTPAPPPRDGPQAADWGPRIELAGLDDLYHPQEVQPFSVPPAAIDNLHLSSSDKFLIPGRGEYSVNFEGYFRVARDHPTSQDWASANVFVNLADMRLTGEHRDLGTLTVRLNPAVVSPGQTFAPGAATAPAACRIGAGVVFEAPDMGVNLFNKEPILLMNNAIEAIPPVEDPNGAAHIYKLPLYSTQDPNGQPVAYLTELRYTVGNYVTEAQAAAFQAL
jgi:hypothetical protein